MTYTLTPEESDEPGCFSYGRLRETFKRMDCPNPQDAFLKVERALDDIRKGERVRLLTLVYFPRQPGPTGVVGQWSVDLERPFGSTVLLKPLTEFFIRQRASTSLLNVEMADVGLVDFHMHSGIAEQIKRTT